jgi:leucyl-tRNA synthetase
MVEGKGETPAITKSIHKTLKKVSEDIENMKFNTAIAAMMTLINDIYDAGKLTADELGLIVRMLCPFAPHICEEIWEMLGNKTLCSLSAWPEYDEAKTVDNTVEVAVQINGKLRATIELPLNCDKDTAIAAAKADERVAPFIEGKTVIKEISVPNRIVNIVVR